MIILNGAQNLCSVLLNSHTINIIPTKILNDLTYVTYLPVLY